MPKPPKLDFLLKLIAAKNQAIADRLTLLEQLVQQAAFELSEEVFSTFLDQLSIKDGELVSDEDNMRKINLVNKAWTRFQETQGVRIMATFVEDLQDIILMGEQYYQAIEPSVKATEVRDIINGQLGLVRDGKNWIPKPGGYLDSITEDRTLLSNIKKTAFQNITARTGYQDLKKSLRNQIAGTKQDPGELYQFYDRFAFDTYSEVDRLNSKLHADRLKLKYFLYLGGIIETSREFCKEHSGRVYTVEQAEEWKKLIGQFILVPGIRVEFKKVPIGPIVEDPAAYIPVLHLGGIRCRHSADYVSDEIAKEYLDKQLKEDIDKMMQKAKEAGPEVEALAKEIAAKYGATVTPMSYKTFDSIKRKSISDYNGDPAQVKDAARNTIIVPAGQIDKVVAEFKNNPQLIRIKKQDGTKDPLGYSGYIVNFKAKNGLSTEIQVNSAEMIYAKETEHNAKSILGVDRWNEVKAKLGTEPGKGHELYEQWRVFDKTDPGSLKQLNTIEESSREYYNKHRPAQWEENLLSKVEQQPRQENESDKLYAKRVIDHLPAPRDVREAPSEFFNLENSLMVDLDKLFISKSESEVVQSGSNAVNRLWAASQGILSRRDPISVKKLSNGTYQVLDGNSTVTAAKKLRWSRLPVRIQ